MQGDHLPAYALFGSTLSRTSPIPISSLKLLVCFNLHVRLKARLPNRRSFRDHHRHRRVDAGDVYPELLGRGSYLKYGHFEVPERMKTQGMAGWGIVGGILAFSLEYRRVSSRRSVRWRSPRGLASPARRPKSIVRLTMPHLCPCSLEDCVQ